MSDTLFSPSWYRVAGLKPRIRAHARILRKDVRQSVAEGEGRDAAARAQRAGGARAGRRRARRDGGPLQHVRRVGGKKGCPFAVVKGGTNVAARLRRGGVGSLHSRIGGERPVQVEVRAYDDREVQPRGLG